MDKKSIRRRCFAAVKSLSGEEKEQHSARIVSHIEDCGAFEQAGVVFSYLALASEPDLSQLVLDHPEKIWAFSRVGEDGNSLSFHRVVSEKDLRQGDFGFLEPDPQTCPQIGNPDLILVPGVGFDRSNGARLGRGKGHYDRFLAPLVRSKKSPAILGICYSVQEVSLEPESHDIPMNAIVTERGAY